MSTKKTRNGYPLDIKYKIVKLVVNKTPFPEILRQFNDNGIEMHNIYAFNKKRTEIIEAFEGSLSSKAKSLRKFDFPELETELLEFVSTSGLVGLPINTDVLKTIEIAEKLKITNFKASNGFIDRFKNRNQVAFKTFQREANGVPDELCDDWVTTKLPELIKDCEPKDVFNGDEFGLFW